MKIRHLAAGLMVLACASPCRASIMGYQASDNINETIASAANPFPVAALSYNGTPLGFAQLLPATAIGLSAPAGSRYCYILAEGQAVRWRDDGTNPTATVGFFLPVNTQVTITGIAAFKMIQTTTTATVDVSCYK